MADYDNRVIRGGAVTDQVDAGLRAHMLRVYNYMLIGLVLTGLTAWAASVPPLRDVFFQVNEATGRLALTGPGWIAVLAPLAMVFFLSFGINRMSVGAARATFWLYAALVGIGIAPILWVYTGASVAETFFITAATFGAMSLWGYTTKTDLTRFGSFLIMGLIGVVIASLVNMFIRSSEMQFIISVLGVLVFVGLTAYDTQRIKSNYLQFAYADGPDGAAKRSVYDALALYLNFINLFMLILQLTGSRRQ
jgi:uncharacterized protein